MVAVRVLKIVHQKHQLHLQAKIISFIFFTAIILSGVGTVQGQLPLLCHDPVEQFNMSLLPNNLRLVTPSFTQDSIELLNPKNGKRESIPNTDGEVLYNPFLYDDNSKMLYISKIADGQWLWQTMNLNGSALTIVRKTNLQSIIIQRLGEGLLLFNEGYDSASHHVPPYQVFDFRTSSFSYIQYPEWQYAIPVSTELPHFPQLFKFNAEANQVAYLAYPLDQQLQPLLSSYPRLARSQDIINGDFVDIEPEWKYDGYFDWFGTSNMLTFWGGGLESVIEIYNGENGKLIARVLPPDQKNDYDVVEISWSPNNEQLLVEWRIDINDVSPSQEASFDLLVFYSLQPDLKLQACFKILNNVEHNDSDVSAYKWTSNGQFIWWLECITDEFFCSDDYKLMMIDISTNTYGTLANEVKFGTKVGFDNSLRQ